MSLLVDMPQLPRIQRVLSEAQTQGVEDGVLDRIGLRDIGECARLQLSGNRWSSCCLPCRFGSPAVRIHQTVCDAAAQSCLCPSLAGLSTRWIPACRPMIRAHSISPLAKFWETTCSSGRARSSARITRSSGSPCAASSRPSWRRTQLAWEEAGIVPREAWRARRRGRAAVLRRAGRIRRTGRRFRPLRRGHRGAGAGQPLRPRLRRPFRHGRDLHRALRHRGAEAALAARHVRRHADRRHRDDRARRRQRPEGHAHAGACATATTTCSAGRRPTSPTARTADLIDHRLQDRSERPARMASA